MSGIGFSEIIILFMIGLIVLGPEKLPRVANQLGTWLGQARRMTRVMRRQLEDELDLEKNMKIDPPSLQSPRDDDTYSPMHDRPVAAAADRAGDEAVTDDPDSEEENEKTA
jgi:sec-independent protein translocase protein TatB